MSMQDETLAARRGFLASGLAAAAALPVLGSLGTQALAQVRPAPVRFKGQMGLIAYPLVCNNLATLVASRRGLLEANGLDLEFVSFGNGGALARALQQGQVQLGSSTIFAVMGAVASGMTDIRGVGSSQRYQSLVWGVRANSGIKAIPDLAGRKVAVTGGATSLGNWFLRKMLEPHKLSAKDVTVVSMPTLQDSLTALLNGLVDCSVLIKPFAKPVLDGTLKVLWDTGVALPDLVESGLWTTAPMFQQSPAVVQQFVNAHAAAMQWIRHNRSAAIEMWAAELKSPPAAVASTLTQEFLQGYDIRFTREGFESNKAAAISLGVVKENFSYEQFVRPEFFEAAYKQYGQ
ncbi:MAG: NrtA/SsuA/CpmA family ABC transporter substrate-binding protein [Pseudomonadota bacterium]